MNDKFPAGRPFGAIMEYEGDLYLSTEDTKAVCRQLKEHENMQIIALKPGTRDWIRVNGIARECRDQVVKQRMFDECPAVRKHYASADAPHYTVFQVRVLNSEFN